MCGIAGIFSIDQQDPDILKNTAKTMADEIAHRGPDDSGVWSNNSTIAISHRRLSIIDTSSLGHQPMRSASDRFIISYNGEIYNHQLLRNKVLESFPKHQWKSSSDTETLLAMFDYFGVQNSLPHLSGMFAIAVWDNQEESLYLIRDRMGEKPLYFGWIESCHGKSFVFSSELKCLRAIKGFNNSISRRALQQYFRFLYVPAPLSIYEDIYKLDSGCVLKISDAPPQQPPDSIIEVGFDGAFKYQSLHLSRWYNFRDTVQNAKSKPFIDEGDAITSVETTLNQVISMQSISDVPLGAFLSGGIDSSLIVALMQEQANHPIQTFTIGFDDKKFDESRFAAAVSKHIGTDHHELMVSSDDAKSLIPSLSSIYDEPFADSSQIPTYFVSKSAKEKVTVSLSGDAGDELFGGYNRYLLGPKVFSLINRFPSFARGPVSKFLTMVSAKQWDAAYIFLCNILQRENTISQVGDKIHKTAARFKSIHTADDLYKSFVTEWQNADGLVIGSSFNEKELFNLTTAALPSTNLGLEEQMMFRDAITYLSGDILCKVDRAAMSNSLETRVPFLDPSVIEIAWRIPIDMKIKNKQGKWVLREILYKYVPKELIERPKTGFGVPIGDWLKGPLKDWAEDLLNQEKLAQQGYLEPLIVHKYWKEHLSGSRDWTFRIWSILMFQSWLQSIE